MTATLHLGPAAAVLQAIDVSRRLYPFGRPADTWGGSPHRHVHFVKRVGWRWEIWHEYEDGHAEPNGAREWRAVWAVKFWFRINALRVASEMTRAHRDGGWLEFQRTADQGERAERLQNTLTDLEQQFTDLAASYKADPCIPDSHAGVLEYAAGAVRDAADHLATPTAQVAP